MIDIGWTEMLTIAVLTIVIVGPKDLPRVMRAVARALNKMRGLAREFQSGMDELAREADIEEINRKVREATDVKTAALKMMDPDDHLDLKGAYESGVRPEEESKPTEDAPDEKVAEALPPAAAESAVKEG